MNAPPFLPALRDGRQSFPAQVLNKRKRRTRVRERAIWCRFEARAIAPLRRHWLRVSLEHWQERHYTAVVAVMEQEPHVIMIQRHFRGYLIRHGVRQYDVLGSHEQLFRWVTTMTRVVRGGLGRQRAKTVARTLHEILIADSATLIEAAFRGHCARCHARTLLRFLLHDIMAAICGDFVFRLLKLPAAAESSTIGLDDSDRVAVEAALDLLHPRASSAEARAMAAILPRSSHGADHADASAQACIHPKQNSSPENNGDDAHGNPRMISRLVQHNGSRIVLAELPRKRQRQLPAVTQRDLRHAIVLMVRLGGKQVRLKEKRAVARVTDTQVLSKRARIPWFRLDATKAKGKLMAMKATAAATAAKPNNFAAAAAAAAAAEAGEAETAAKVK